MFYSVHTSFAHLSILSEWSLLCCSSWSFFHFSPFKGYFKELYLIQIKGLMTGDVVILAYTNKVDLIFKFCSKIAQVRWAEVVKFDKKSAIFIERNRVKWNYLTKETKCFSIPLAQHFSEAGSRVKSSRAAHTKWGVFALERVPFDLNEAISCYFMSSGASR